MSIMPPSTTADETIAGANVAAQPAAVTEGRDYSDMINTTRVRSSLRRLFGESMDEIFGELLQNSQRANASTIAITTCEEGWTFTDNGDGLVPGLDGFWTLLRIAESFYQNPTILAQDPMGLGIHVLLAHQQVSEVTFTSGNLALTVQPDAWWNDEAYYASWHQRVVPLDAPVQGFQIDIRCTPRMVADLRKALEPVDYDVYQARKWSAFQGYDDVFASVTCDGVPVRTAVPRVVLPKQVFVQTTYMGQELIIGGNWDDSDEHLYMYGGTRGRATCNWFGQLIPVRNVGSWVYYLKVRDGRPINPKSPSRQGVIEDMALEALEAFVRDQIFAALVDPANRECITPLLLNAAYLLDPRRAGELPYFVAAPYMYPRDGSSLDDLHGIGDCVVFAYNSAPLLLADELALDRSVMDAVAEAAAVVSETEPPPATDETTEAEPGLAAEADAIANEVETDEWGLYSFVPVLAAAGVTAYKVIAGNYARLTVQTLYWQPGRARADEFNELGRYGFGPREAAPTAWFDVTGVTNVFSFTDPSSYDAGDISWTVGTTDPLDFLANEVWFGFSPDDDEDYDHQEEQYRDSVNAWKRRLIGDCVPRHFQFHDVQRQMPTKVSPIVSIKYVLPRKKRGVTPAQDDRQPVAIIARNAAGERKHLKLVA